jgi:hypothetical protein
LHLNIPARPYTNRIDWLFPVEGDQENKTGQENLLHHLGHLRELGKEATSKKHTLLLNT